MTGVTVPATASVVDAGAVVAVGAVAGGIAGVLSGRAAAAPIAFVAVVAVAAAGADARTGRIPNGIVVAGLLAVIASWGLVSSIDGTPMSTLAREVLAGGVLSGAPALFAVWLVSPHLIGGGDWKLLAVLGLAVGYLAPGAAVVVGAVGFAGALLVAAATRRRHVTLGPSLAAGYLAAVAIAVASPHWVASAA
jgi:leader peptidase (prepilin peptidase)/N-methyltransferase